MYYSLPRTRKGNVPIGSHFHTWIKPNRWLQLDWSRVLNIFIFTWSLWSLFELTLLHILDLWEQLIRPRHTLSQCVSSVIAVCIAADRRSWFVSITITQTLASHWYLHLCETYSTINWELFSITTQYTVYLRNMVSDYLHLSRQIIISQVGKIRFELVCRKSNTQIHFIDSSIDLPSLDQWYTQISRPI